MMSYFAKMKGSSTSPPAVGYREILWSWMGAFLGMLSVSYINFKMLTGPNSVFLIASFGASAVLIYGAPKSPLAQPRNVIGGHVLAAIIGVIGYKLLPDLIWIAAPLVVATAIALMHFTKTLHPPAGATGLVAVIGGPAIYDLGFSFALTPIGLGALILTLIGILFNNIPSNRRYPEFWI